MRVLVVMLMIGVLAVAAVCPASVLVERGGSGGARRGLVGEGAIAADAVRVGRHGILLVTSGRRARSEEHTSELQSLAYLVCRLLLEKKKKESNIAVRNAA